MNMVSTHKIDQDGTHHVFIDGLRVWAYQTEYAWIAQGIDLDYVTSGESLELAVQAFTIGLSLTVCENLKRFHSIERLVSRKPPQEIIERWKRAIERSEIEERDVELPTDEFSSFPLPPKLRLYGPAHVH